MKNKILLAILTNLFLAETAYSMPLAVKTAAVKFSFAMLGVVVSSVAIWLGLVIYNKIRDNFEDNEFTFEDEGLKTPKTKDDAINFYIRRNKLK